MKFAIQWNLISNETLLQIKEAIKDLPHEFIEVVPFSHKIKCEKELIGKDFIPYGSTLLTNLALELKWNGLFFNLEKFNYSAALENRNDMLNGDHVLSIKDGISLLETFDKDKMIFTRPSHDLKQYSGQVIRVDECLAWFKDCMNFEDNGGSYGIEESTQIVISEPKDIQAEWRWFIVNGKIIDGSMYRAHGQLIKQHEMDQSVIDEAQTFANKWLPAPCCVMDLALVDKKLYVIEFNTINSSGMYNHDVTKIFKSLYKYCNETEELT